MENRLLIIDSQAKEKIQKVVEYAEQHVFTLDQLKAIVAGTEKTSGDNPGFRCHLEVGYRVVFTIEEHPSGKFRHISISVDESGKSPNIPAVEIIMKEFQFKSDMRGCQGWVEDLGEGMSAVNLLERYNPIKSENQ